VQCKGINNKIAEIIMVQLTMQNGGENRND
jgi:hypothetical protein